jgi:signal transduction histidine kinase
LKAGAQWAGSAGISGPGVRYGIRAIYGREIKSVSMKHLYLQFYLTIVVSLVLVVLTSGIFSRFRVETPSNQAFEMVGELAATALPAAEAPREAQQLALGQLAQRLGIDISLFSAARERIATAGRPMPAPRRFRGPGEWLAGPAGLAWAVRLPDGRWLVAGRLPHRRIPALSLIGLLGGAALVVGLAAFPVARRVTRRLERLQTGVESLGAGDLSARVKVEGRDEVARLAKSFNNAAARIESLVNAHKMLLANASHELRTPLARLRLGVELLKTQADPDRKVALEKDIAELDQLIDEILLSSRLEAVEKLEVDEEVDLLALAAEECARYEQCTLNGAPVLVRGDPRLLRRVIRNLADNAVRHGKPPVEVEVKPDNGVAVLRVADHGDGITEHDRELIFSPFFRLAGTAGDRGAGLGLALVRQIAHRHAGRVEYGTNAAGENVFTVRLPSASSPS